MTKLSKLLASTGLALLLASCGSDADETPATDTTAGADMAMNDPTNPFAQSEMTMSERMMTATGANVSETYLRKMLAHHRGAVAHSDVVLANGATGRVRTAAQKVKSDQTKEGAMIEAMLAGEPMPMASSGPEPAARRADPAPAAKPSASTPTPEKAAAPAKPTTLKPAPTPIATPTTDPHAGMKM